MVTCSNCKAASLAVRRLRDALQSSPTPRSSPLEHRRRRAALLREANRRLTVDNRTRRASYLIPGLFALSAVVASTMWHVMQSVAPVVAVTRDPSTSPVVLTPRHTADDVDTPQPSVAEGAAPSSTAVLRRGPSHTRSEAPSPDPIMNGSPSAGERFDEAVSTFTAREFEKAEVLLLRFMQDFPADPRCEDASFMRAVARAEFGDKRGAASAARSYLETYPKGFRRAEAQRIVDRAR
jgi:TolA-binding protein